MTEPQAAYFSSGVLTTAAGLLLLFGAGRFQAWVCKDQLWLERRLFGWFMETALFRVLLRIGGGLFIGLGLTMVSDVLEKL